MKSRHDAESRVASWCQPYDDTKSVKGGGGDNYRDDGIRDHVLRRVSDCKLILREILRAAYKIGRVVRRLLRLLSRSTGVLGVLGLLGGRSSGSGRALSLRLSSSLLGSHCD